MAGSAPLPAALDRGREPSAITTHDATTGRPQSAHTRRAYAADWQAFSDWCAAAGQPALPATPEVVAGHLPAWLRQARIDYGAVFRRVTAAGTLEDRLSPQGVWRILRRRAGLARLHVPIGSSFSPDGLRASPHPPAPLAA